MKRIALFCAATLAIAAGAASKNAAGAAGKIEAVVTLNPSVGGEPQVVAPEIYGQFAEHLGTCIYGGLWVGPHSDIPNTQGYRNDVLQALKELHVPVMRWPGGCFADEYHWRDGIGDPALRPRMVNNNWGGTVEDNSFGTHEFFNLCELLGCEPYLSGNVGSGTVEELAKWVEYITAEDGPMARLRRENGREKPWKLKYLGVGNESWGCGGEMRPEYYADLYRRYQVYCRNYDGNKLFKIASGASDYDYRWTETLMSRAGRFMQGLSLHYYTVYSWSESKGSALHFTTDQYYWALAKCREIEDVIKRHASIMDIYDSKCRVALMVDEWGTWWDEEPGTVKGHLYQQNTMRDAMVAALSLNVFHRNTGRVKMANIAQVANVLQSMVLTRGDKMALTPTYYVFKMYVPHQGGEFVPVMVNAGGREVASERGGKRWLPNVDATATRKDGTLTLSLVNVDANAPCDVTVDLAGAASKVVEAVALTGASIDAYNEIGEKENVAPVALDGVKVKDGKLSVTLPPHTIATISLK